MSILAYHASLNSVLAKQATQKSPARSKSSELQSPSSWEDKFIKILDHLSSSDLPAARESSIRQAMNEFALQVKRDQHRDEECLLVIGPQSAELYLVNETRNGAASRSDEATTTPHRNADLRVTIFSEQAAVAQFFRSALGWMPNGERNRGHVEALRRAHAHASEHGLAGVVLNRLFQRALWLFEKVRLETDFFRSPMTVSEVLIELAGKIFGGLKDRTALLAGSSEEMLRVAEVLHQAGIGQLYFSLRNSSENQDKINAVRSWCSSFNGEVIPRPEEVPITFFDSILEGKSSPFIDLLLLFEQVDKRFRERPFLQKLMAARNSAPLLLAELATTAPGQGPGAIFSEAMKIYNLFFFRRHDLEQLVEQNWQARQQVDSEITGWIREEVSQLYQWLYSEDRFHFGLMVGRSRQMQRVFELIARIAQNDITVLIEGESGTGKELVARAIHQYSRRAHRPFIVVNCSALPENLLESELFGHVRGAFTGAVSNKRGLIEEANGGTIFLDEIGEMSPALQVKLLRFLQDGEIKRVGSNAVMKLEVRVIAATNRNLQQMVNEGKFRSDLYYRLNVIQIALPPLRERAEDVHVLANHFLRKYASRMRKPVSAISPEALQYLCAYAWPGNVRELENVMERAVALATDIALGPTELPAAMRESSRASSRESPPATARPSLQEVERQYILETVNACQGNYDEAARILGIGRTTLWRKLKAYLGENGDNLP